MTSKDRHGDSGSFYFFFRPRWHPNSPPPPTEAPRTPPPSQKICYSDCTENCPLRPLGAPRRFRNPKIGQQLGAQPTPRLGGGLGGGLGDASPARRGSPSRTASPPAPLAIRKAPSGRRRKSRRQSHKFFKHLLRLAPQLAATPWGGSPPRPLCQKI